MKPTISNNEQSTKTYYACQFRITGGQLKFQVPTTYVNRSYGCTFTVDLSKHDGVRTLLAEHQNTATGKVPSLHVDSKEKYITARLRVLPNNLKIRVQVRLPFEINRPYGLAFDVYQIGLYKSLKTHIRTYQKHNTIPS